MATPNIAIYEWESVIETAVASWLARNDLSEPRRTGDSDALPTPRVEIKADWGPMTGHYWINPTTGEKWPDASEGTINVKVVTSRMDKEKTHSGYKAMVRWLMQDWTNINTLLTHHHLDDMWEQGTSTYTSQDEMTDTSDIAFRVRLSIKPESFPQT